MDELVGKTIAAVRDLNGEYGDQVLVFTDGTRAILRGTGYEADGVDISLLSGEQWMNHLHDEANSEDKRRDANVRYAAQKAEADEAKARLSQAEFVEWLDQNRPGWKMQETMAKALKEVWSDTSLLTQMHSGTWNRRATQYGTTKSPGVRKS